jgi:hypothetical protein
VQLPAAHVPTARGLRRPPAPVRSDVYRWFPFSECDPSLSKPRPLNVISPLSPRPVASLTRQYRWECSVGFVEAISKLRHLFRNVSVHIEGGISKLLRSKPIRHQERQVDGAPPNFHQRGDTPRALHLCRRESCQRAESGQECVDITDGRPALESALRKSAPMMTGSSHPLHSRSSTRILPSGRTGYCAAQSHPW